jgi:hypothetical protein
VRVHGGVLRVTPQRRRRRRARGERGGGCRGSR